MDKRHCCCLLASGGRWGFPLAFRQSPVLCPPQRIIDAKYNFINSVTTVLHLLLSFFWWSTKDSPSLGKDALCDPCLDLKFLLLDFSFSFTLDLFSQFCFKMSLWQPLFLLWGPHRSLFKWNLGSWLSWWWYKKKILWKLNMSSEKWWWSVLEIEID